MHIQASIRETGVASYLFFSLLGWFCDGKASCLWPTILCELVGNTVQCWEGGDAFPDDWMTNRDYERWRTTYHEIRALERS
ncbi:hypothetical protein F4774DRAFT_137903 [Daldinia eschscholtzii]|nr:hypothetical protein F4774DRAFT_137903 [Daldinia eschscholtzii]